MKIVNWIIENIYWVLAAAFLVMWGVSYFALESLPHIIVNYVGFFGCLILHGISRIEQKLEELESQNINNIEFVLPSVSNYDEILNEMNTDENFKKLIESMTIENVMPKKQ